MEFWVPRDQSNSYSFFGVQKAALQHVYWIQDCRNPVIFLQTLFHRDLLFASRLINNVLFKLLHIHMLSTTLLHNILSIPGTPSMNLLSCPHLMCLDLLSCNICINIFCFVCLSVAPCSYQFMPIYYQCLFLLLFLFFYWVNLLLADAICLSSAMHKIQWKNK